MVPIGRPTKYSKEIIEKARQYVEGGYIECGDPVPTLAGLALELGIHKDTVFDWEKQESKAAFSELVSRVRLQQERDLVRGGLNGKFNPKIAGLMMSKHGYKESEEAEQTQSAPIQINFTEAK